MCATRNERRRPDLLSGGDKPKPLVKPAPRLGEIFADLSRQIRDCLPAGGPPVDVELQLDSVTVSERGFLIFSRKTSSTSMSIKLATRITARVPGKSSDSTP